MAVRTECRHYSSRSTAGGEEVQRCRLEVNDDTPFACPPDCLFFEPRKMGTGWQV
ncbi:MAG: hypothetical protein ACR2PK_15690 [Acidimicrobiales bacterium]